ncbi:MAG TPA: CHAP domain-containing protein [Prosthecobacter sp.]|nr:CHAP domain-containing protein [Prosthecobacter sp.]
MATLQYPGRLIRKGEKDKDLVSKLQTRLREVGCGVLDRDNDGKPENLAVDGDFGPMTDEAVRVFQARFSDDDARMEVDGVVGPTTWGALFGAPSVPEVVTADAEILKAMLAIAVGEVGVSEDPPGSNAGKKVEEYLGSVGLGKGNPWCAAFVYWCFQKAAKDAGVENPCVKTGHVLTSWNKAKPSQRITSAQAKNDPSLIKPGLVFIMDTGAPGGAGHTGIVEKVVAGTIYTIEGNTNKAGSREGTGVFRKTSRRVSADSINKGFIDYSK